MGQEIIRCKMVFGEKKAIFEDENRNLDKYYYVVKISINYEVKP